MSDDDNNIQPTTTPTAEVIDDNNAQSTTTPTMEEVDSNVEEDPTTTTPYSFVDGIKLSFIDIHVFRFTTFFLITR